MIPGTAGDKATTQIFARSTAKLLHRATYVMDKAVDRALQDSVGISLSQFLVLKQLDGGKQCQRELAVELGVTAAAISRQVGTMLERGWLKKLDNQDDRRYEFLILTQKGKRVHEEAVGVIESVFARCYDGVTDAQQRAIYAALTKLIHCYERPKS